MARKARAHAAAARSGRRDAAARVFTALAVEGALIVPAQLALIADAKAEGQDEADYGVPRGLTLRDEIPRFFRIGQALWNDLAAGEKTSRSATLAFAETLLRDVLGFADVRPAPLREQEGRVHPVTLEALDGRVPIMVVPPNDPLDRLSDSLATAGKRTSAALALQDWLNASEGALWGLACNGEKLRLVRDNPSLTRPAYVEADLRQMFEAEDLADFTAFWLLLHASRFGRPSATVTDCWLERWRDAGQKAGVVARDRLRDGVEESLKVLGSGFLSHSANTELRRKLEDNSLGLLQFHGVLLRLVYRLIFLLTAEDRNLLHEPGASAAARQLYANGYSLGRLRARSAKRTSWDSHDDLWDGLQVTFAALARGEDALGLPALAGLFAQGGLGALEACALPNRALMAAVYRLAWLKDEAGVQQVNWRDMETEELGSVYEALLELTPRISAGARAYGFAEGAETRGNERKTTGSYYTPDSLVQLLLNSTLDPVLDRAERENEDAAQALLDIKVIDPACGSGHFLLAAARRIATRLARQRAGGAASAEDYRHALRDVARACIHGVDRNPMAVELTKVALWIETVEPGKPLGFLDANIRCGDALLGVFDLSVLEKGIPDAAYKPLSGDDAGAARIAAKANREQKAGSQRDLFGERPTDDLARQVQAVIAMSEDDVASLDRKARAWEGLHAQAAWGARKLACDIYVGAFLRKKHLREGGLARANTPDRVPTTLDVWTALAGRQGDPPLTSLATDLADKARAFHWPLEFPAVMHAGGFDVVLGNPPWERIKLQEQEFFSVDAPEIAQANSAAARGRMIAALAAAEPGTHERNLHDSFEQAKRTAEAASIFARLPSDDGGRFPLTGRGDVNTYALFAELFLGLAGDRGYAGLLVPTGIATDATTAPYFTKLMEERRLASLYDFQTGLGFFDRIGHARFKFCLITMAPKRMGPSRPEFCFFVRTTEEFADRRRHFTMSAEEMRQINPNTGTVPVLRSPEDVRLMSKLYGRFPVLVSRGEKVQTAWSVNLRTMFHKTNASRDGHIGNASDPKFDDRTVWTPLHEGEYGWQFDHRLNTFDAGGVRLVTEEEHKDLSFDPQFELVGSAKEIASIMARWGFDSQASSMLVFRRVARSTDERTTVATILPAMGMTNGWICVTEPSAKRQAILCANFNSLVFDYCLRNSLTQPSIPQGTFEQTAIIPPARYDASDTEFVVSRVLELTYTSWALQSFARNLGYGEGPFRWNEERRAQLRAELDAWYARAYGLTREELRYIIDPADVMGPDYPSETFRVLKEKEVRRYGEYRTQRLVLEAWDALEASAPAAAQLAEA